MLTRLEDIPVEEFLHPRSCGHTDNIKEWTGLCHARISKSCTNGLAISQFNGFPTCAQCQYYLVTKACKEMAKI